MKLKKLLPIFVVLTLLLSLAISSVAIAQEPTAEATAEPTGEALVAPTDQAPVAPTDQAPVAPTDQVPVEATAEPVDLAPVAPTDEVPAEATAEPTAEVTVEPTVEATAPTTSAPTTELEPSGDVSANASTTKSLSTNFTLVNLAATEATVNADYRLTTGAAWTTVPAAASSFTVAANGGQVIFKQYDTTQFPSLASGQGSVMLSSSQPLGAVVQIRAIGQTATEGAYSGITNGSSKYYVPLVSRQGNSADGTTNSQIVIQNTGDAAVNVQVQFYNLSTGSLAYTKDISGILAKSSSYYDLDTETNLPTAFYGSAVVSVTGSGSIAVISNFFSGPHNMQTFNAFAQENIGTKWLVPLITSRLTNGLSTPVTIQNLSGSSIAAGQIQLNCIKDAASAGTGASLTLSNSAAVVNNGAVAFNPVVDTTNFPTDWYGSCTITAPGNVVAFVQMRFVGRPGGAAAYEAINANGTGTTAFAPLIAKRLTNGFATALTIQNLGNEEATVSIDYVPGAGTTVDPAAFNATIPVNGSYIQNQRTSALTILPDNWVGSVKITSTASGADGQAEPISGFAQLTFINGAAGDTYQAHNIFTVP